MFCPDLTMMLIFLKNLLFIQVAIATNQISLTRYLALTDFRASVFSSSLYGLGNSMMCLLQCEKFINCTAVNFHTGNTTCELIEPGVSPITPTASPGWTIYYSNSIYINPMFRATATQSSTYPWFGGYAYKALDGGKSSNFGAGSCTHTDVTFPNQWLLADFTAMFKIHGVIIWNRLDASYERLSNIVIFVSPSLTGIDDPSNVCGTFAGPPNPWDTNPITVNCTKPLRGRYVKVVKQNLDILHVCELELILV